MNRVDIKKRAKEFAFKNKWNIWKPFLVIFGMSFAIGMILEFTMDSNETASSILKFIFELALLPTSIGYIYYMIKLINGENVDLKDDLFCKYKIVTLIFIVTAMIVIITFGWTLLLIIPGIIYSYKVIMVNNILADTANENTKWYEVIDTSKKMMDGYKMDYFIFELSFIGWILLSLVTCGIALIWVMPYIQTANIMYYQELKKIKKIK